jgi:hypothetical protein
VTEPSVDQHAVPVQSWNLGVREVSGLGLRRDPRSGLAEFIAVSDRTTTIARLRADGSARLRADRPGRRAAAHHRVRGLPDDLDRPGGPQWEGVAADGAGRVVVLGERGSELVLLSPEFAFDRRIRLRHEWEGDRRAGLEALVLLRDGHVLAAKQRRPVRLLEFGPAGDRPIGLVPSAALPAGEAARLPPGRELVCLASWGVVGDDLPSVNDLSLHAGFLHLVSSASRRIARIRLPATGPVRVERWWSLPDAVIAGRDAKAEGLIVDDRVGVLVAVDSHRDRENLHLLGRSWPVP